MEPSISPRGRAGNTPLSSAGARAWQRCVAAGLPTLFIAALGLAVTAAPTSAGATTLYAYAAGGAVSPTSCPQTATTSEQCRLAEALSLAKAGATVALATPGKTGHYVGNWSVATLGTSSAAPLTIRPALGVTNPVLDGDHGKPAGCQTKACDGPVLTIGSKVHLDIYGLTVQNADNTTLKGDGGAIQNIYGGTLIVSACTFFRDSATQGGAIDNTAIPVMANGTVLLAIGTVTVSGSTFTANTATGSGGGPFDGGAIDNADGGRGAVTVSASTFSANTAGYGPAAVSGASDGGAIDNADNGGTGTLAVSASTFSANSVRDCAGPCSTEGGAIDSADNGGTGTLAVSASTFSANSAGLGGAVCNGVGTATVSASTFTANTADYGAAIDNGNSGTGSLTVSASTFSANRAEEDGSAIRNGYANTNSGTLTVTTSTFSANSAAGNPDDPNIDDTVPNGYGGAIDNEATGTLAVSASTFSANTAKNGGGSISNSHIAWAAADIFNGGCHQGAGATWADEGYNVGADATCLKARTGDVSHGAGHLGRLAHNGGPTETMLALAANPALSVVPLNTTVKLNGTSVRLCPTTDQRGEASAAGKACNAGAVQSPVP
ncbi:MAG: choice-of-anchor Q domain-containing protein [Acidimicrobiales bacterium]